MGTTPRASRASRDLRRIQPLEWALPSRSVRGQGRGPACLAASRFRLPLAWAVVKLGQDHPVGASVSKEPW